MELGIVVDDISSMILAAWMVKKLGDWLKKVLPSYLQMIFNPLITVLVVSTITLVVTGPIIQGVANGIADFINWLVHSSGWVGGLVIGGFYQLLVIFGLHWALYHWLLNKSQVLAKVL